MAPNETTLTLNVDDRVSGPAVDWAVALLEKRLPASAAGALVVEVASGDQGPEGFSYRYHDGALRITATDPVGASYALVGLVDQVELSDDLDGALRTLDGTGASTSMPVRGIMRSFSSVDEDLPWYRSREFWTEYLDWIAQCRFSRFHLALGMQYNYGADRNGATDNYLCFAYPFLIEVPGWNVTAKGVDADERAANLEMLRFVGAEVRRRGMKFQLGLWNHAYDYGRNSRHRFEIRGLTPETHAPYCADAMTALLAQCPDIDGFSFRVHYEGGIHDEGHEVFWGQVFDAISASGRTIQVDMHAKGVDEALLDAVDKPGLQPVLGAKYWAEHQGLPYHQASIRRREESKPVPPGHEMTAITEFSRRFTRYGYADFLSEDRRADLIFRVWPGTQKLLLWGDPELAAGYGRLSTFAGSLGVDVCEPLFFKGRKGSGSPGRRDPYIAEELKLGLKDWTKYAYTYRLWGRKLYNPEAPDREWAGLLRQTYGELAGAVESALAPLSRILPLVTTVHGVGGSNNGYWPEVYTNLPITAGMDPAHYTRDTEDPPMWGTVSPFDPTTFYVINDWAADALAGQLNGKYTPIEVAEWIERCVQDAEAGQLALIEADSADPQIRRTSIDVQVLSSLGRFFAAKFRSAADYALYQQSGDLDRLEAALTANERARDSYAEIVLTTEGIYQSNMMFGPERNEHGSWTDRLPAIEADVSAMENELKSATGTRRTGTVTTPARPKQSGIEHTPPAGYGRGSELLITVTADPTVSAVRLHYRHVNQAEHFEAVDMTPTAGGYTGTVPAEYTASTYPLMYFFTVDHGEGGVAVHPGLESTLANQPYYVVRSHDA